MGKEIIKKENIMKTIMKGIVTALVLSLFLSTSPKTAKADVTLTDEQFDDLVYTIVQKVIANIKAAHEGDELGEEECAWPPNVVIDPRSISYQRLEKLMLYWQKVREEIEEGRPVDDPSFQFIR